MGIRKRDLSMADRRLINGFTAVELKFNEYSASSHTLLWRRHTVKKYDEAKPAEKTLYIINVPPYCTEQSFIKLFSSKYGKVEAVHFHEKPTAGSQPTKHPNILPSNPVDGFKVAYIVFSDSTSVSKAVAENSQNPLILSSRKDRVTTGMKKWMNSYNRSLLDPSALNYEIASIMKDYDEKKEKEKDGFTEPDSEGWVTVVNTKKKSKQEKLEEIQAKVGKKKKKKNREIAHFYSFIERQNKMDHLVQLRKKFEEDKKRIAQMREARKFKPY